MLLCRALSRAHTHSHTEAPDTSRRLPTRSTFCKSQDHTPSNSMFSLFCLSWHSLTLFPQGNGPGARAALQHHDLGPGSEPA